MKMIYNYIGQSCVISNGKIIIDGKQVPPIPGKNGKYKNVTTINSKVYIDGYEFIDGQWKKTLKALWHKWF